MKRITGRAAARAGREAAAWLEHDIRAHLLAAGHGPAAVAALGEGLGPR
ncbi:hypothetical protein [Streptomyces cahuitamycinicus]|nr:hypothetical protein [Streptomyces cahuitamycinicus]